MSVLTVEEIGAQASFPNTGARHSRLPRAPAPKSQTPTRVASLLGDLGFPATTEGTLFAERHS